MFKFFRKLYFEFIYCKTFYKYYNDDESDNSYSDEDILLKKNKNSEKNCLVPIEECENMIR